MFNGNSILAIIPARGGSKGVRKKNIRFLEGKPLIQWTIDAAQKSKYIGRIVVSTEDPEIAAVCRQSDTEVIARPVELARDDSPTMDCIFYTLDALKREGYVPEHVILLQCTTPFRTVQNIDEAIEMFFANQHRCDSVISVTAEEYPPYWLKRITSDGLMRDFLKYDRKRFIRRQDFEKLYKLNGSIYITKTERLYLNHGFQNKRTLGFVMDQQASLDIDTEDDFKFAEYVAAEMKKAAVRA